MAGNLKDIICITFIPFERWSRSKIASPVGKRNTGIREEIVGFRCPLFADFIQGIQVAGRCRIENVHIATILLLSRRAQIKSIKPSEGSLPEGSRNGLVCLNF